MAAESLSAGKGRNSAENAELIADKARRGRDRLQEDVGKKLKKGRRRQSLKTGGQNWGGGGSGGGDGTVSY
jgi:hypothetical protein